jgi:signal transduction histidine kinase
MVSASSAVNMPSETQLLEARLAQVEEALRQARADQAYAARVMSLGALSASIAHEIKQPLSGIITNAGTCLRMLAADPPDIAGARETARRTLRDGNRASDVITRLRALFTRRTANDETADLNQLALEAVTLALSDLQCRRVMVVTDLAQELPAVRGDRIQLHQVILNLILNAADAMGSVDERPRRLKIRTQRESPDRVLLCVEDTGTGFAAHEARLFDPFYTTKSDGMGIGLSISRAIIDMHGGRLWATQNEGPGATFWFCVPCEQAPADTLIPREGPCTVSLGL